VQKGPACLIMLNRNSSRAAQADADLKKRAPPGVSVFTVPCDLQNISEVRQAASSVNDISARFGGLDVLALNAGVMDQPDDRTLDGFDVTMQTNHLSHFLLTKLLLPSLQAAAGSRDEVRVVSHSSLCRGTSSSLCGGSPANETYYLKSAPGSLGGNSPAAGERYHQTKLANIVFAMALHKKFASAPGFSNFKALSAAPGFSDTSLKVPVPKWFEHFIALSAPDGSCSLLTAMFAASARSGDFYEPSELLTGPPVKVIDRGTPLPVHFASIRHLAGIRDTELCSTSTMAAVWNDSETGLGEKFEIQGYDSYLI